MSDYNIPALFSYMLCAFLLQLVWARRHIFGIFDPLFYFIVSSAFAITLSALTVDSELVLARVVSSFVFFWAGFSLTCRQAPLPLPARRILVNDIEFFIRLVLVGAIAMLALNYLGWAARGVPLLSDNPSVEKVDGLTDGLGFIRRFNWGVGVFVLIGSLYWFLGKRSFASVAVLVTISVVIAQGGSKSALLPVLFAAGLYLTRPFSLRKHEDFALPLRSALPVIALLAAFPVATVFLVENEGLEQAVTALSIRLLYFGDVMLYWGQEDVRNMFAKLGPLDYPAHLVNGVTGFLRVTGYDTPLGTRMVNATLDRFSELDSAIGPNTPFYVKGEMFFGPFAASIYAFSIGALYKWFRVRFFRYAGHSLTRYSALATLMTLTTALPIEDSLFIVQLFDFGVFFFLIYFVTLFVDVILPRRKQTNAVREKGIAHVPL